MSRDPDRHVFDVGDDPGPDANPDTHLERAHEEMDREPRLSDILDLQRGNPRGVGRRDWPL